MEQITWSAAPDPKKEGLTNDVRYQKFTEVTLGWQRKRQPRVTSFSTVCGRDAAFFAPGWGGEEQCLELQNEYYSHNNG